MRTDVVETELPGHHVPSESTDHVVRFRSVPGTMTSQSGDSCRLSHETHRQGYPGCFPGRLPVNPEGPRYFA